MPFIRTGDIATHYELTGPAGAPVVMFSNSLGTNFHIWDAQAAALQPRYRVLRYDTRGHGLTDAPAAGEAGYGMDQLAEDALALLDRLRLPQAAFCGLSIGGMIGQCVAARAPERVTKLILCDTALRIGPAKLWEDRVAAIRQRGLEGIADNVVLRWFTPAWLAGRADEARGYRNMLVRTPADGYIGCSLAIRGTDLAAEAARIRAATLVIVGDQDQATPPESARDLAAAIAGARLELVTDAAHISSVEQPQALAGLIGDFLDRPS